MAFAGLIKGTSRTTDISEALHVLCLIPSCLEAEGTRYRCFGRRKSTFGIEAACQGEAGSDRKP